jgi:hypothetical protein
VELADFADRDVGEAQEQVMRPPEWFVDRTRIAVAVGGPGLGSAVLATGELVGLAFLLVVLPALSDLDARTAGVPGRSRFLIELGLATVASIGLAAVAGHFGDFDAGGFVAVAFGTVAAFVINEPSERVRPG